MKKVLVMGDSLTLPRRSPEFCAYEDTWPVLLRSNFNVHQVSIGGGTIKDLNRQAEYHKEYNPDIVIIQSGIVDCAPRALTQFELELISKLWGIRKVVLPLIKRYSGFLRRYRKINYTSIDQYIRYIQKLKQTFEYSEFLAIGILPAKRDYELIVPGVAESIEEYNKALSSVIGNGLISMADIPEEGVMKDNIHLSNIGHLFLYNRLIEHLGKP